ncbi:MAG: 2-oxoisovalerate dehydrogenase [Myxococcota bacterium]|jgi:hypothetical protein|nr:2-oxoisovalerate dehydrogenase [Myxococcota bacterium]
MPDAPLEFIVEQTLTGGYQAQSLGACIFTEAPDLASLRAAICEAVCCHFDEGCQPQAVRLRFVTTLREELLTP